MAVSKAAPTAMFATVVYGPIGKSDGGYTDILVSIHPDVTPNEDIVHNLKVMLKSASRFLHTATNGRVHFKKFIIELPKSWPKRKDSRILGTSYYPKSDVRIRNLSLCGDDGPYTVTSRGCGQKGDFIHLPADYLLSLSPLTTEENESSAYTFVHEWAHLRYGVFDDYGTRGDNEFPETYCAGDKVKLNACSENIYFTAQLSDGSECSIDDECHFEENCIVSSFIDSESPAESSIMFMPYVQNVSHFCESSQSLRMHNSAAPTKHNKMCNGVAVLDVIHLSDDFKELAEPNHFKHIDVAFEEWQERADEPQKIVLVLDVSGSMSGLDRMALLKEAAKHYIQAIPDGLRRLAVVSFSTNATVTHDMLIVNSTTRQGFIDKVNALEPAGQTCIDCGLELARKVLTSPHDPPHGSIILLVTDGEENRTPYVASVMQNLVKSLIELSTFAIGREADKELEALAAATKGQSFCFRDSQPFNGVNMGAAFVTASASEVEPQWPVTVLQVEKNFTTRIKQNFTIGAGLAKNAIISVRLAGSTNRALKVGVTDPSGQKCASCKSASYGDTTKITLPDPAKTGTWTLHLERGSTDDVSVSVRVFSQPTDNTAEPIRSRVRMMNTLVGHDSRSIVIVDATKGKRIILNASVTAEITDMDGATTALRPLDDGQDPDVYSDDGKYTDYYNNFEKSGRYILKAYVSGHNVNVSCRMARSASSIIMPNDTTGQCSPAHRYPKRCCPSYNGTFKYKRQRPREETTNGTSNVVVDGGPFYLEAHNMSLDPPLKPWKFRVCCERPRTNGTLLLQMSWNWAGAHLNFGKASSIDIRVRNESESLKQHFESQEKIDSTNLVEGTLEPGEARTHNVVTISLPGEWAEVTEKYTRWNLKFAARTTNSLNVTSDLSDIADLDYFNDHKYTSEATVSVPTRSTAAEESSPISTGGNTAEYNNEMYKSTTEDSDDGQMSTSKAPRREPTSDPEAPKGSKESTGGHSEEDKDSDDGTASTYSTPLVLGLLVAAVAIVSAGLWALRINDKREAVIAKKSATELTATPSMSVPQS